MYHSEKVHEAVKYIKNICNITPKIALVLGSGLGSIADNIENAEIIPYKDIPYWPQSTVIGHSGKLIFGNISGVPVVVMQGRVHYYEGYTMEEVTFPVRVLASVGIKAYIATNASGSVNLDITPGSIAVITDHINFMGTNPLIGPNNDDWGARFPDMTTAYDKAFTELAEKIAARENIPVKRGVYCALTGPSFETPAEIRMIKTIGGDLVGMSTVPEVIVANHMGLRVLGLSCASNYAAGITGNKLTHAEVLNTMIKTGKNLSRLIELFIREVDF